MVLVHVWSEFGRRARENGSDGTDHGAGGLGLLIGVPPHSCDAHEIGNGNSRGRASGGGVVTPIAIEWCPPMTAWKRNIRDLALKGFSFVGVFTQQSGMAATVLGRPGRLHSLEN